MPTIIPIKSRFASNKMENFTGKIVLVTGAGKGAGRKIAQAFAARGAIVAANDISPVNVEAVVDEINSAGGRARAYVHDVAKKVDVQAMVNNITDDFGRIDVLVNCAHVEPRTSLINLDEWDLHRVFEVNAIGTLLMIQSVGRVMRTQDSGIIINVVRIAADSPVSFIASRAGIGAVTQRAGEELAQHGIHVFSVTDDDPVDAVLAACEEQ
jgi:NAD(P)-dependent dehydrogenase (short-subunit alcohol dehydrogenase family)